MLLYAGAGAGVQCDSGGGDCGVAGDCDAGMGRACECDGEYAAGSGYIYDAAGRFAGLRTLRADECGWGAVLLGVRGGAVVEVRDDSILVVSELRPIL